ncbi:PAS domain S-box protein [Massilia atriviolacea]|uniref:histidine kinase n=1 Tax=Massilia atriviolacea TaxID=2495579 RepID=A0A430HL65_9BURK|nr:PAS domain-containing sensor histidine kinase [Massilia atriviolacea]RSZ58278.1 PAS domain-containing sensor histidine kinase [Massilia atriviolacea]
MDNSVGEASQGSVRPSDNALVEQFRAIAELRGDVAWIVDAASGALCYISPSVRELLGYDAAYVARQLASQDADAPLSALCAGLPERLARFAAGDLSRRELLRHFELVRPDGGMVPVEVRSTLLSDAGGKPGALVGVLRDATAERARADEKRRFASMLNHEFRTPLSTIDGAVQRLEATATQADEPTRQRYRKIQAAVDRLIGMLDQYLSPDRMDEIGSKRQPDSVSPALLLEEAAAQVGAAGGQALVERSGLPPLIRAQPSALRLALKVLVDNALQYSPPGQPILLAGHATADGIALSVRDRGNGVPAAEIATIFDKGYRGSNAVGQGSGLGLYMARSVIEVHGGTIDVQNGPSSGAVFKIWLPAQRAAGKTVAPVGSNSDNSGNQHTREGTARK